MEWTKRFLSDLTQMLPSTGTAKDYENSSGESFILTWIVSSVCDYYTYLKDTLLHDIVFISRCPTVIRDPISLHKQERRKIFF